MRSDIITHSELKQGRGDMLGEMNMPMLGEMSTLMDNMPSMMRPVSTKCLPDVRNNS